MLNAYIFANLVIAIVSISRYERSVVQLRSVECDPVIQPRDSIECIKKIAIKEVKQCQKLIF